MYDLGDASNLIKEPDRCAAASYMPSFWSRYSCWHLIDRCKHTVLLVAPNWPGRIWFPVICRLFNAVLLPVPQRQHLLSQSGAPFDIPTKITFSYVFKTYYWVPAIRCWFRPYILHKHPLLEYSMSTGGNLVLVGEEVNVPRVLLCAKLHKLLQMFLDPRFSV